MKAIQLTQGQFTIVDDEDYEYLNQWKWYVVIQGGIFYAVRNITYYEGGIRKQRTIRMHRLIMNPPQELDIDHINHNGLDNRKVNLRTCTAFQNQANKSPNKNKQYKGITKHKCGKFQAYCCKKYIGLFVTEKEAAIAYNNYAVQIFGEYSNINIIES